MLAGADAPPCLLLRQEVPADADALHERAEDLLVRDGHLAQQTADHAGDLGVDHDLRQGQRVDRVEHAHAAAEDVGPGAGRDETLERLLVPGLDAGVLGVGGQAGHRHRHAQLVPHFDAGRGHQTGLR